MVVKSKLGCVVLQQQRRSRKQDWQYGTDYNHIYGIGCVWLKIFKYEDKNYFCSE